MTCKSCQCRAFDLLQELAAKEQQVTSLRSDEADLEKQLAQQGQPAASAEAAAAAAAQHGELAKMADELARSKTELQEALAAAAELQKHARQLRRETSR